MVVPTQVAHLNVDELYLLNGLLAMPTRDSFELVSDLAGMWAWMQPLQRSLDALSLAEWQREYQRLFIHGKADAPCPPFESFYRDERVPGLAGCEVAKLYAHTGIRLQNIPADYLGSELNLLAELIHLAEEVDTDIIIEMWERLGNWVPKLARDLSQHASLEFYQVLGQRLGQLFDVSAAEPAA